MAVKIAGIITLGLVVLGLLVFVVVLSDRKAKQEDADRKHRLAVKEQNDTFTLNLFGLVLSDQSDTVTALRNDLAIRDDVIAKQQRQIDRMNKNAEKLNLKEELNK